MSGIMNMFVAAKTTIATAVDEFFNRVTLLLNTGSTNGAQNNTFIDSSSNGYSITRNPATGPNAPTQGTFTPFSQTGWSNYFNGSTDYLTVAGGSSLAFGSGDFSLEAFVYPTSSGINMKIYDGRPNTTAGNYPVLQITLNNVAEFLVDATSLITGTTTILTNKWTHILVSRVSGNLRLFINGVQDGSTISNSTNFANGTARPAIGSRGSTLLNDLFAGYISNVRVITGSGFTSVTVPTTTLTPVSGTLLLTCQSNRFFDSGTANSGLGFTVSSVGTPSVQAFSPFAPTAAYSTTTVGGSGYFNNTDYLTVSGATALAFGTNEFTISGWVYFNAITAGANQTIYDGRPNTTAAFHVLFYLVDTTFKLTFFTNGAARIASDSALISGQWYHFALSKDGGTTRMFINGVQQAQTYADTNTYVNGTNRPAIGVSGSTLTTSYLNGYLSGLKVNSSATAGVSSVTVPTAPPTTNSDTQLLLNFTNAGIYDAASKNVLETVGNAQVVSPSPAKFGTTSIVFDGTGDYLLLPDSPNLQLSTGDFTIEGFVYLDIAGVAYGIISKGTATTGWSVNVTSGNKLQFSYTATQLTGATSLAATTWYYFAVVRSGSATGNLKLYIGTSGSTTLDATSAGAVTDNFNQTNSMYVGASRTGTTILDGYLDEIRITKGYARTVTTVPTAAFPIQ
jgi:hypothetical protein